MTENLGSKVSAILEQSIQEENLPVGTLQRIALKLRRLEQGDLAQTVEDFASACTPELEFFRTISQMPAPPKIDKIRLLQSLIRKVRTYPMINNLSFASPFKVIEGVAVSQDKDFEELSGPFFIAVAGNFSEDHLWGPKSKAYLFSPALNAGNSTDEIELRVFNDKAFEAHVTGKQGKDNSYIISLNSIHAKPLKRGDIQELFEAAVEDMTRFAFGPGSSLAAREAFKRAADGYVPQPRVKPFNPQPQFMTSIDSVKSPLTLENTPDK